MSKKLVQVIALARKMQQREVNADQGLNFDYILKVGTRMMSFLMQKLTESIAEKLKSEATHGGKSSIARKIHREQKKAQ